MNRRFRTTPARFLQKLQSLFMIVIAGTIYRFNKQILRFIDPQYLVQISNNPNSLVPQQLRHFILQQPTNHPHQQQTQLSEVDAILLNIRQYHFQQYQSIQTNRLREEYIWQSSLLKYSYKK